MLSSDYIIMRKNNEGIAERRAAKRKGSLQEFGPSIIFGGRFSVKPKLSDFIIFATFLCSCFVLSQLKTR